MKSKNVFGGVILVTIGLVFLLRNMGVIYFTWYSLLSLWPVFLIVLGISLLPVKSVVRIILAFLVIILSLIYISNSDQHYRHDIFNFHDFFWDDDPSAYENDLETYEYRDQQLFETYSEEIDNAVLELDAIAGDFSIFEDTDYLLKFDRQGNFGKYYMHADNAGSAVVLRIGMKTNVDIGQKLENTATISLHPEPLWNFKIDAGAAKLDFDLSPYKIDRFDLDGGASSIKVKFGDQYNQTHVGINSGAAAVVIEIPQSSGCEVLTNTILTSKNLDGFMKIESGVYQTDNFETAGNNIFVRIDAALSSLKVVRY
jgi:hypothetical protein